MNFTIDKIIEDNVSLWSVINDCIALVELFEPEVKVGEQSDNAPSLIFAFFELLVLGIAHPVVGHY